MLRAELGHAFDLYIFPPSPSWLQLTKRRGKKKHLSFGDKKVQHTMRATKKNVILTKENFHWHEAVMELIFDAE
jgi:hypothetical protein